MFNTFSGVSADGVYQAKAFLKTINQNDLNESSFIRQVGWDPSHWMNLAVTDVKDGKIGSSKEFFSMFIKQTNKFSETLNRGKGIKYSCLQSMLTIV